MLSFVRKLPFVRNYTSAHWETWWQKRQIDWREAYLSTWDHPHRNMIVAVLKQFNWGSLLEVGCGAGANLVKIVQHLPNRQLGGCDVNPEAIKVVEQTLKGAFLKVCPAHDIMMSDSSCDVILSDMTMIYYGGWKIHKAMAEIKRVARNQVIFCEFHTESRWESVKLAWRSGYHAHNYRKLLAKHGFYDVMLIKVPDESWPGSDTNQKFRYIIIGKVPKRK